METGSNHFLALVERELGVLIVDADATLLFANSVAEAQLRNGTVLTVAQNQVAARHAEDRRLLARLIHDAAGAAVGSGGVTALRGADDRRTAVLVAPLNANGPFGFPVPAALLFIGDGRQDGAPIGTETLRDAYGLTAAEARLLSALMGGCTLQGYAASAGVALATVKTQLAQIFAKTDCHRQSDLIREVYTNTVFRMAP